MKNQHFNKEKVISSLFWKLMERCGTQGIQLIVQIILARLLMPEEYGLIAIVMVFISLANIFIQSGFSTALVQKKDTDEVDFSSIFYINLLISVLLYIIIFISAPYIASFYFTPQLTVIFRVLPVILIFGAFNSVQYAFVARNMLFRRLFISSLVAIITSGILGIAAAYIGLGVWALVIQQISNQLIITIVLWFSIKWRPRLLFSYKRVKVLFTYGSKLLISALIDTIYTDLCTLLIGRLYNSSMVGFYNKGKQLPQLLVDSINVPILSVLLPTLSVHQDDKEKVKEMMRRAVMTTSFILFPMMIGLAAVAEPLVRIILTEKWLPAVPFIQIFCFQYALRPIHTANLQAIKAIGRSDIYLKLEIIKKVIGLTILIVSLNYNIYAIAFGVALSSIISTFINAYPNKVLLNYSNKDQLHDIIPPFLIAILMGGIVYAIKILHLNVWSMIVIQVIGGILIYFGLSKIFKIENYTYIVSTIKQLFTTKKESIVKSFIS